MKYQLCTECNNNFYRIENFASNINEYFNCYNETPKGYFLDKDNSLYKKCYDSCEICEIKGNNSIHNCIKCKSEFNFEINFNNYINCYKKCIYYYYFDENNNYHCTDNEKCPHEYPILIEDKKECIFEDIKSSINQIEDIKLIENIIEDILNSETNKTKEDIEEEINNYNKILEKIEEIFTSDNYDLTNIEKGEDQVINADKIIFTFTTIENQKNNLNNNMTTINIGDCEQLLRQHYNLLNNETLYMKKMDIIQDGMNAKKIEFDIYSKLSGNNLEKLNLTICNDTKIYINIPTEINGNIDKLNTSSGYFNDICYISTTDDGTDITLNDRKKEYVEGNNIICQEDCYLSGYDTKIKIAKCECHIKESSSSFADMKINKNKLFENFKDIKNIVNFEILICYKKLLNITGIFYNIGSLIMISIFIFHIICIFIFYLKQLDDIMKKIKDIIFALLNSNLKNEDKCKKINKQKIKKNDMRDKKINKIRSIKSNNIILFKKPKSIKKLNFSLSQNQQQSLNSKKNIIYNYNINKLKINIQPGKKINNLNNFLKSNHNKQIKKKNIKKIMDYNNDEINELSYNFAVIYDKRTFCQYYSSLLKSKHSLIFSFCKSDDYNSKIIKIDLFFIEFAMLYTINALFFNDETMHKIYVNKGSLDLETQLPITLYSSLITMVLDTPLTFLSLSNDIIINLKQIRTIRNIKKIGKKISECLKYKFILYFIISFMFLLFFWYYISMFGVIYENTKYHLLKDTLLCLGLSFLYPFAYYLLPGFFRIPSLSNPKKKRKCLYYFSKILQYF